MLRFLLALGLGLGLALLAWIFYFQDVGDAPSPVPGYARQAEQSGRGTAAQDEPGERQTARGRSAAEKTARVGEQAVGSGQAASLHVLHGARLSAVDAETGAPLEGLRFYDQKSELSVGTSDADGVLLLNDVAPGFLVAWGDGFLTTPLPATTQQDLVSKNTATLRVYRDRYTMRRALHFSAARLSAKGEEGVPARATILITLIGSDPETIGFPTARVGPGRDLSKALRDAWEQHVNQVLALPHARVLWHLGPQILPWNGRLAGLVVRFSEARRYRLRARSGDGRVAEALFEVAPRKLAPIEVEFVAGREMLVRVEDAVGRRLPDAIVSLSIPALPLAAPQQKRTDADGQVRFKELFAGDELELRANASGYTGKTLRVRVGGEDALLRLASLPVRRHELRVREYQTEKPIARAKAWLGDPNTASAVARSDAQGRLRIELVEGENAVLSLEAKGYLPYRELLVVSKGARGLVPLPSVCHLIPADREKQLAMRLIAKVSGRVFQAGKPAAGLRLRLLPARTANGELRAGAMEDALFKPVSIAGRQRTIFEGDRIEAVLEADSDAEGRFVFWPAAAGHATIQVLERDGASKDLFVVLGKAQELVLR